MKPTFELIDITCRYGNKTALQGFTLRGERGEVIAMLGGNGAGKTTALKVLLGLLKPTSGTATVFGLRSETRSTEIRRRVGYISDEPALYDYMKVDEIGWFCAGFYEPGFVERFQAKMDEFSVPRSQRIKTLSRGQRAKVSLGLALAHEPELLVMDEPTSGLDPVVRRQFLESMVDVAAQGTTVLLASHQVEEVERVADRVAIVRDGKLDVCEPVDDLKNDVREVRITWANGTTSLPASVTNCVVTRMDSNRQSRLFVRGLDDGITNQLSSAEHVSSIEVHSPSLEEIYLACMNEPQGQAK